MTQQTATAAIELTKGLLAIVDEVELPNLVNHSWHASLKNGRAVAQASMRDSETGAYRSVLMHRHLMCAKPGQVVDHINGDPLDNRLANLRIASAKQNARNHKPKGASGFNGVRKSANGWSASIAPDDVEIALGTYPEPELAAAAYNAAAKAIYGQFARLNNVPSVGGILDAVVANKRRAIDRLLIEIARLHES